MNKLITIIRKKIDTLDEQLVELIKQRLDLVKEIGRVKAHYGLPIQDSEREAVIIAKERALAQDKYISADLIEDIFRRVFQESYINEVINTDLDESGKTNFSP